jgi:hypothetical protein
MSRKSWGNYSVVVTIGTTIALGGIAAFSPVLMTLATEEDATQNLSNEGSAQIDSKGTTQTSKNNSSQIITTKQNDVTVTEQQSTILSVPCVNGGGSGGWMYEGLPEHYFPIGLVTVNEWPLRSIPEHSMYDPEATWNEYGTCIIVPAKYP